MGIGGERLDSNVVDLGISTKLFALPKPSNDTVVVGGEAGEDRWTRVVTRRVAHALWYQLTVLLYPERSEQITPRVTTAAFRDDESPTITAHIEVLRGDDNFISMAGTGGQASWLAHMSERDARALWGSLDKMLFPLGWEG
jgi:hypothetical protein